MTLADFKLHPLQGSKFYFRIRIFDTKENMEAAAVADGSMTGEAQACFCGTDNRKAEKAGEVYLWDSPTLRLDAVHELTHAAVHYVREVRHGDLAEPNRGEYASRAEELLCRTMEGLLGEFFIELARFLSSPQCRTWRIKKSLGNQRPYTKRQLQRAGLTWRGNVNRGLPKICICSPEFKKQFQLSPPQGA